MKKITFTLALICGLFITAYSQDTQGRKVKIVTDTLRNSYVEYSMPSKFDRVFQLMEDGTFATLEVKSYRVYTSNITDLINKELKEEFYIIYIDDKKVKIKGL